MNITVIGGTGYVGLVTGAGYAAFGHNVCCADIDSEKVENLKKGIMPIYEQGLEELVKKNMEMGTIQFTTDIKYAVEHGDIIFITVGTPENEDGSVDMRYITRAAQDIGKYINDYKVIINKSTAPLGTGDLVEAIIQGKSKHIRFDVVSNPEFLREGSSVYDFFNPERIVIGVDNKRVIDKMKSVFLDFKDTPIVITDRRSAEIVKYAANTYLAARLSFINEIAELCEKAEGDIQSVVEALGYDHRIGKNYLNPGIGFGGPCLIKDLKALINTCQQYNCEALVLDSIYKRNEIQIENIMDKINDILGDPHGKTAAVLGLAFKPKTDDTRNAPALSIIEKLKLLGMSINVYDPKVKKLSEKYEPLVDHKVDIYEACKGADIALIITEWDEFKDIDFKRLAAVMNKKNLLDGRNIYSIEYMKDKDFNYYSIGRVKISELKFYLDKAI